MPPQDSSSSKTPTRAQHPRSINSTTTAAAAAVISSSTCSSTNPSGAKLPTNWPREITYLTRPTYSRLLDSAIIQQLCPNPSSKQQPAFRNGPRNTHQSGPSPFVKIKKITDPNHPAYGQHGLFANHVLLPGQWVLDYLGYVHPASETDPESNYDLSLDRELGDGGVGIDARHMGNEARFVNDYRGIPERMMKANSGPYAGKKPKPGPNVVFAERVVEGTGERRLCIMVGKERIKKCEELCVSYGKGFWKERGIIFDAARSFES
ncbi:hypothetical protein BDZ91DRAFT_718188 [Kalaharituber pfeilii]|nr:hypothetical protein BDZ91DRAFT_718188 [Kalaharituber pfeilii]